MFTWLFPFDADFVGRCEIKRLPCHVNLRRRCFASQAVLLLRSAIVRNVTIANAASSFRFIVGVVLKVYFWIVECKVLIKPRQSLEEKTTKKMIVMEPNLETLTRIRVLFRGIED